MSRMNDRISAALLLFPIESWSVQLHRRQFKMAIKLASNPNNWAYNCMVWFPPDTLANACRLRGRPKFRWDDHISNFNLYFNGHTDWLNSVENDVLTSSCENDFVFFMSSFV